MGVIYKGPGRYVAICNDARFEGHYVKIFDVPFLDPNGLHGGPGYTEEEMQHVEAGWYFLNRIDFVACLEAVYPLNIFRSLAALNCSSCHGTGSNTAVFPIRGCAACGGDGLLMPKKEVLR
jgi:DnaJ-class molecular chaperone